MQPFSRNPQIRLTHKIGDLSIAGVLSAQRDFTSPLGSSALRYSNIPDLSTIFAYEKKNEEKKSELLAGFAVDYKSIQPFLTTKKGNPTYITDEKVTGVSTTVFFKMKNTFATVKAQITYGQNLYDLTMLGGYIIKSVKDTLKNTVSYSPLNNLAAWTEFQTNGKNIQFGFWWGYSYNLGSNNRIVSYSNVIGGIDYNRGTDIKKVLRLAPRVVFIQNKLNFATELEYTSVDYATKDVNGNLNRDEYGLIIDTENVSNIRLLFSLIYNF
jgi:hypothetical protein